MLLRLAHVEQVFGIEEPACRTDGNLTQQAKMPVRFAVAEIGIAAKTLLTRIVGLEAEPPAAMLFPHCDKSRRVLWRQLQLLTTTPSVGFRGIEIEVAPCDL